MSFTTRCPACGTVFRVVADQLKISDGWVRCGHCSDVFDATIHLEAWVPSAAAPAASADAAPAAPASAPVPAPTAMVEPAVPPPPVPEPTLPDAADDMPAPPAQPPEDDDLRAWFGDGPLDASPVTEPRVEEVAPVAEPAPEPAQPKPVAEAVTEPVPEPQPESEPDDVWMPSVSNTLAVASRDEPESDFHAELERFAHSTRAPLPAAPPDTALADAPETAEAAPPAPAARDRDADAPDAEPGFVRQARRRAFWNSPGMRVGLALLTLMLALLLAAQWAIQERHRLVAAQPALKPWILQACDHLGCDLAPVRQIDAIVIDSAELVRRLGNFHSFDIVLHNQSPLEVALPALELTLTDTQQVVVARRVFLPQDWPAGVAALPPHERVSVSFRLSISLGEGVPTAGYRALVFYP
ncbi:MAG: DUF3426 domain-containing protein [Hydrogenophaga sp.]|uniref:DUF3426 domain-containing protein n=1 Tax=Hydrogenophaga sp. TaxID=1904254 RepID=UPI00169B0116|nr:DUF3426 domain-containing protein [Hydrogenophaga sp.]NIM42479.1 DUF3426 domain-containing protein [Hydrogenophaga sp.]NIN27630.1 DUF3426 domain-containing protein [Hydrogenophaga sp.]NIN32450.1 DUF3426 domain-containing protein [Hydrogenophaga sp.]NIN56901.1 DUF3426 domain-containing protein [Hydrogenophaga sp.]NIO53046.1 DUF3426 domain-containing protein [Hydrogenophaga sp.]